MRRAMVGEVERSPSEENTIWEERAVVMKMILNQAGVNGAENREREQSKGPLTNGLNGKNVPSKSAVREASNSAFSIS
jgi:hypothetical protein